MVVRKFFLIILVAILLVSLPGYQALAHVCDDVLRHDPIAIWPEKETIKITNSGQFKIFLRNGWAASIHKVELIVPPSPFEISVIPNLIERVLPEEHVFFLVNLTIPQKAETGPHSLLMKVNAQEFEVAREVNLKIQVEQPTPEPEPEPRQPEATIEIIPKDVLVAMSAFPDIVETEPGQVAKFKIFVRSGHTEFLHDLVLSVSNGNFEVLDIAPSLIKELRPGDTTFFEVTLSVPKGAGHGDYLVLVHLKAQELPLERVTGVSIRVKKVNEWLPYLYILAILLLISLLIWRWQGTIRQRSKLPPGQ